MNAANYVKDPRRSSSRFINCQKIPRQALSKTVHKYDAYLYMLPK